MSILKLNKGDIFYFINMCNNIKIATVTNIKIIDNYTYYDAKLNNNNNNTLIWINETRIIKDNIKIKALPQYQDLLKRIEELEDENRLLIERLDLD